MGNTSDTAKGVAAIIVILVIWMNCSSVSDLPDNPSVDEIDTFLYVQVRSDVKPLLRNPKTASFASRSSWRCSQLDQNVYSIQGSVNAENAYGGMVHTPIYAVYLFAEPSDEFLLEALRLGD